MNSSRGSAHVRLVKVALISPSDVMAERDIVETVVGELNRELPSTKRQMIELQRWETSARPGMHLRGPQGLVDEYMDVAEADIVVAILWKRFGTPTGDAQSGTEYELRRAWASWEKRGQPDILAYFCDRAYSPRSDELEQWRQVHRLRDELVEQQILMLWSYREVTQFERLVRQHLRQTIAAIDGPARMTDWSRGMEALLGRVRLRVEGSDATFDVAGEHTRVHEVCIPGAVIGSGDDVDVRLVGAAAAKKVSRRHLLVRPSGHQWVISDCDSTNRTHELDADHGTWHAIPADVPVPVEDGMLLCLGPELVLRFERLVPLPQAGATPHLGGPGSRQQRIRPMQLEQLAIALLHRRRTNSADRSLPSIRALAAALSLEPSLVKRGLRDLRTLAPVRACLTGKRPEQLADALELAFPYLVAMLPEDDPLIVPADPGEPPPRSPTA